jgi:hypothetical protein
MTFPLLRRFRRVIADRHACDSLKHGQRPTELLRDYAGANALALQMRQLALGVAGSVAELALGVAGRWPSWRSASRGRWPSWRSASRGQWPSWRSASRGRWPSWRSASRGQWPSWRSASRVGGRAGARRRGVGGRAGARRRGVSGRAGARRRGVGGRGGVLPMCYRRGVVRGEMERTRGLAGRDMRTEIRASFQALISRVELGRPPVLKAGRKAYGLA